MKYDKAAIVVLVAILCSLILLPFVVFAITTISTPWGFINDTNREAWIGYYGAIIGGALTLGGVWWTIKKQEEEKKMEFDINNCPLLTAELLKKVKIFRSIHMRKVAQINGIWHIALILQLP